MRLHGSFAAAQTGNNPHSKHTDSEVAAIFSNPAETAQLWFENDYAAGFTKLLAVIDDEDAIRVVLGKE